MNGRASHTAQSKHRVRTSILPFFFKVQLSLYAHTHQWQLAIAAVYSTRAGAYSYVAQVQLIAAA